MGHTRTALRVQMACSKQYVNSYLQQIAYSEIHFSRGGGGLLPSKSAGDARRTFKGIKIVNWYRLGCQTLK